MRVVIVADWDDDSTGSAVAELLAASGADVTLVSSSTVAGERLHQCLARVPGCQAGAGAVNGGVALASRVSLRASTARGYEAHIRGYLVPYLGGIPLAALTAGDVQAMFTAVIRDEAALGRSVSAATLHRIHATLRAALNGAIRAGLIGANPGHWPELPKAARPRPQVWTPA